MSPQELLSEWKQKSFKKTNYENIQVCYDDAKYIRMKPKSFISFTPGYLSLILRQPKEWTVQNLKLEQDATLLNETPNILYFTVKDSLFSGEEKELKLYVKYGIPNEDEEVWEN